MRFSFIAYICLLTVGLCAEPSQDPSSPSQILRDVAGKIGQVAEQLDDPQPVPKEDWRLWPDKPVVRGDLGEFGIAPDITDVKWVAVSRTKGVPDPKIKPDSNGVDAVVAARHVGSYYVMAFGLRGGKTVYLLASFEVVETGPGPGPEPPVPPVPPVPVVEGKRRVVIVRESADTRPELGILFSELRNGEFAKYVKANGHTLDILDDELLTDDWKQVLGDTKLPAVVTIDVNQDKALDVRQLPSKAAEILTLLKQFGG